MSVYLAEECKDNYLQLTEEEDRGRLNFLDEYDPKKPCMHHVHIGLFFDGTNNNKYRDLPNHCASNVARLFEAFTGTPAKQEATLQVIGRFAPDRDKFDRNIIFRYG